MTGAIKGTKDNNSGQYGKPGNPGGMTRAVRRRADEVREALSSPDFRASALRAYKALLDEGNPFIVKDWMDRVIGKPKERVEISEDPDAQVSPIMQLSLEELKAIARDRIEREAKLVEGQIVK